MEEETLDKIKSDMSMEDQVEEDIQGYGRKSEISIEDGKAN